MAAANKPKAPAKPSAGDSEVESLRAELAAGAELLEAAGAELEAKTVEISDLREKVDAMARASEPVVISAPSGETATCEILDPAGVFVAGAMRPKGSLVDLTEYQFSCLGKGRAKLRR